MTLKRPIKLSSRLYTKKRRKELTISWPTSKNKIHCLDKWRFTKRNSRKSRTNLSSKRVRPRTSSFYWSKRNQICPNLRIHNYPSSMCRTMMIFLSCYSNSKPISSRRLMPETPSWLKCKTFSRRLKRSRFRLDRCSRRDLRIRLSNTPMRLKNSRRDWASSKKRILISRRKQWKRMMTTRPTLRTRFNS